MKVLIVHNNYGKYSGEEAVVDKMVAMLGSAGHEVSQLRMTSEGARESLAGKVRGFAAGVYSPAGVRAMREALRREQPDVVNIHNLYPFISPAALFECRKVGVPVVMTIHNFRLICPTGLFMRDGGPCELCLSAGNEWNCVKYNCEHSLLKSAGYALRNAVARLTGAYKRCVTYYACITNFQRERLIAAGFDAEKITVIPNSVPLRAEAATAPGDYVAYVGRLSAEKGLDMIFEVARRHPEIAFCIAGEARDKELLSALPQNVTLVGYLTGDALDDFCRGARFFVMASRWYEGFPMSILDAAQFYRAVVGPNHGGFTEIIGEGEESCGALFTPGDTEDLERKVKMLWEDKGECEKRGLAAHSKLVREYATEPVAQKWEALLKKQMIAGRNLRKSLGYVGGKG